MNAKHHPTSNERLARSEQYLGKDRDQLREIILDRDEEIAQLYDTLADARETNYESECAKLVTENSRLRDTLTRIAKLPEPGYDSSNARLMRKPAAETLSGDSSAGETTAQRELTEALSHEGAKDFRIEALEAALDWALPAVFEHYTEGESPKTPGAHEEIEKGRARVLAELERLRATGSPVETTTDPP